MSEKKFHAKSTALEVIKGHDLTGFETIVTGGASGIGTETVRALTQAGARVIIGARDVSRAEKIAQTLRADTGNNKIEVEQLDLASLKSVRNFVKRFLETKRPLHILINNEGIMACPKEFTEDGFESQFGTNHIGHFALTVGLLPALKEAAKITGKNARVVSLSSLAHARSNVDFADVNFKTREYDPWVSYGQSKTANVLFSVGLTQRYAKDGIYSNAVMPGGNIISNLFKFHSKKFHSFYLYQGIMTNLQKNVPREEQIKRGWIDENGNIDSRFKTVEQGASTSIFAAVALELENKGGLYLEDCREADRKSIPDIFKTMTGYNEYATDPDAANRLWELSEKLIQN